MKQHKILDRLYGYTSFTDVEHKLFQTKEMARLNQVSLSAIPTWTLPAGVCASKFEHSVGVAHLARIVGSKPEFSDIKQELFVAALAHDIGTPPFSHASEFFLEKLYGINHEEFADEIIDGSEFANVAKSMGVDLATVKAFIKGDADDPYSDIINGSIDVDNLDNSLRFGLSMGIVNSIIYSPERLADSYRMVDGKLVLMDADIRDIHGWDWVRKIIYQFVYSNLNLAPGTVLMRAMDFADREGELKKEYFMYTDAQAFEYLATKCNPTTQKLIDFTYRRIIFDQVFTEDFTNPSPKLKDFCEHVVNRGILADEICQEFKLPKEYIAVQIGKNKAYKSIHLPLIDQEGTVIEHSPYNEQHYMIQVYAHPSVNGTKEKIAQYTKEQISTLS